MQWPWRVNAQFKNSSLLQHTEAAAGGRKIARVAASLILVSACGLAAALLYLRTLTLDSGEQLNHALTQLMAEQTSQTFQATNSHLKLIAQDLHEMEVEQRLDPDSASAMLRMHGQEMAALDYIWVTDPQGRVIFSSIASDIGLYRSNHEFFRNSRLHPDKDSHVSVPLRHEGDNVWVMNLSRRLDSDNGQPAGNIVAGIKLSHFDQLWRKLDLGPNGAISLFRRDATLMMRSPAVGAPIGKTFPDGVLFSRHLPQSPSGQYEVVSPIDGQHRSVHYQTLDSHPDMIIVTAKSFDDILARWKRITLLSTLTWLAAALTVVSLSRKAYRQSLQRQQTELHFRQLAQAMPQIVYITDADGALTFVSDLWVEVTGKPVEEALNDGFFVQIHPDDRQQVLLDMRKTRTTGISTLNEHRMLCKDGVYRWRMARSAPNRDKHGDIVSWFGTSTDIDELKQAEFRIQAKNELMRMAGKLAKLGGWTLDVSDMQFNWSAEVRQIVGIPANSKLTLMEVIAMCAPDSRDKVTKVARDCLKQGKPFDIEVELTTTAARKLWVRVMGEAVRDSAGNITHVRGAHQDITEYKLADQILRDVEQRHSALFDNAPVPMWVRDKETFLLLSVNEAALKLYGYSREEFMTMTPVDLRAPSEHERMRQLMAEGLPVDTTELWTHRRKDGSEFPVESIRREVRYGDRDAVYAVVFDISARVKAEKAVHDFMNSLRRTAQAAQRITQQRTLDGVVQELAEQAKTITGSEWCLVSLSRGEDPTRPLTTLIASNNGKSSGTRLHLADGSDVAPPPLEAGPARRLTDSELAKHPHWQTLGENAGQHPAMQGWLTSPLLGREGNTIGMLQLSPKDENQSGQQDHYVATQLTELTSIAIENVSLLGQVKSLNTGLEDTIAKRTGQLVRQEALFRALAEQAPQPIWMLDPDGAATFVSQAWLELFGGESARWMGTGWHDIVHPDDLDAMLESGKDHQQNHQPYSGVRRLMTPAGDYRTMSYRVSPVLDDVGEVMFWIGIDMDITEIKAIEAELRTSNKELEAFSYSVSHDLRSPLNAVSGFRTLLAKELAGYEGKKTQHYLARMKAGVDQMGELIEGLLALAQVTRQKLQRENIDLSAMAGEIFQRLQNQDPERQVTCHIGSGLNARGDSRLISVVMENLLGNAWKYSSRRAQAEITVGWSAQASAFFVRDNGAGFDMAYADKLFATFQRLHTASEFAGTGVGLATVARVIERHGGRIWAESVPDQGATFFFTLTESGQSSWAPLT